MKALRLSDLPPVLLKLNDGPGFWLFGLGLINEELLLAAINSPKPPLPALQNASLSEKL